MLFEDRQEAGRLLAERLEAYRGRRPLVLGLPRGGVVVAYEVARALEAPLDVVVTRKLGAPDEPEMAIGAIAPGGVRMLDPYAVLGLDLTNREIETLVAQEQQELARRLRRFGCARELPDVQGRTVILVDDGLATGYTALAAVEALRRRHPERIVLAVAVAAPDSVALVEPYVDDFVCVDAPEAFLAVGQWYRHFEPVTDDEVVALLDRARRHDEPGETAGTPDWLREIDHTGDVGIEVSAASLEELFVRAARGLFFVLTDPADVAPREARSVTVEAADRDALMVRWLSELNFLHATQGWLFCDFEVEALDDRRLAATARGERYDPGRHTLYTEIKAVTFHGLRIERRDGGWHLRIIFDL